jgi:hypothetical protein
MRKLVLLIVLLVTVVLGVVGSVAGDSDGNKTRWVVLEPTMPDHPYWSEVTGKVKIESALPDSSNWPDFPVGLGYSVHKVPTASSGWQRPQEDGRDFYTIYMSVDGEDRLRLQSFNTDHTSAHQGGVALPDIAEEDLFLNHLHFWVCWERDDNLDLGGCFLEGETD